MYQHTVAFRLNHAPDSAAEATFISESREILTAIDGVENFTVNRQVSPKSELQWQFSMEFADIEAYRAYNDDQTHLAYVAERWVPQVADFQELDYIRHA